MRTIVYGHGEMWTAVLLGFALGADSFSLGLGLGARGLRRAEAAFLVAAVAGFHFALPLVGSLAGDYLRLRFGAVIQRAAAAFMVVVGSKMAAEGMAGRPSRPDLPVAGAARVPLWIGAGDFRGGPAFAARNWAALGILAFGVSVDSLSAGFTLGSIALGPLVPAAVFAGSSGAMSGAGLLLGKRTRRTFEEYGLLAGGAVMVVLGLKLFW